jgi:hypothetical protein
MALKTFHFTASIPAHRDYLEPLGRMIAHALEYVGVTKGEADTEAAALAAKVEQEIGAGVRGQVEVRFRRDAERLHIEVHSGGGTHKLTRHVRDA